MRRSGKQTVRLDRRAWLADRKKMFARPMLVGMRDVELQLGPGRATAHFTQEWASGSYSDVGPKVIELVVVGQDVRIGREEMLRSRIVKVGPPRGRAVAALAVVVNDNRIVLAGDVEPGWAATDAALVRGAIPARDPSCDDDPPDYEADQQRYWDCEASDPQRGYGLFAAAADVDLAALPPALASWVGARVRLGGGDDGCEATVARLELYGELQSTFVQLTRQGDDDDAIAAEVMRGAPVLTGVIAGGCKARWAERVDQTPPVAWAVSTAPDELATAVRARMRAAMLDDERDDVRVRVLSSPTGRSFALGWITGDDCDPTTLHVLYALASGRPKGEAILDDHDRGYLTGVVDADGDGWPELVFEDGVAAWDPELEGYVRERVVRFPDEITECGD